MPETSPWMHSVAIPATKQVSGSGFGGSPMVVQSRALTRLIPRKGVPQLSSFDS